MTDNTSHIYEVLNRIEGEEEPILIGTNFVYGNKMLIAVCIKILNEELSIGDRQFVASLAHQVLVHPRKFYASQAQLAWLNRIWVRLGFDE